MSDADRLGDELQSRLRGLAGGAERTAVPGMADVRRRRARRQRNAALATAAAVVAVVGAATLVLQPLGDDPRLQPIGPGPSASRSTDAGGTSTLPTGTSAGPPPTSSPSTQTSASTTPVQPQNPILALDLSSLATRDELTASGVPVRSDNLGSAPGTPFIPPLCGAATWQEGYSDPLDFIGGSFSLDQGTLQLDLMSYPDAVAANAALVKLKDDARACPTVNEFLTAEVSAVGLAVGEEFVTFRLNSESSADGSVRPIWITIARTGNVLVEAVVTVDSAQADTTGNEQQTRDAAQTNVDHLLAG